jgi:hypothetical protein
MAQNEETKTRYKSPRKHLMVKSSELITNHHPEVKISSKNYKMVTPADLKPHNIIIITTIMGRFNVFKESTERFPHGYRYTNNGRIAINKHLRFHIDHVANACLKEVKKNGVMCKRIQKFMHKVFTRIDITQSFTRFSLETHIQTIVKDIVNDHLNTDATILKFQQQVEYLSQYVDPDSLKLAIE